MNPNPAPVSRADIESILGRVPDELATAIMQTGATAADVEIAENWACGQDDVMGKTRHPLEGPAAAVYEILRADQAADDEP